MRQEQGRSPTGQGDCPWGISGLVIGRMECTRLAKWKITLCTSKQRDRSPHYRSGTPEKESEYTYLLINSRIFTLHHVLLMHLTIHCNMYLFLDTPIPLSR